ncbi:MAG: hypothetical protein MUP82_02190 [Candidatus Marinimicrobia bacterium]|nr:hypothetical protein [Candidatus Neomarinimicrobiota bacterium]
MLSTSSVYYRFQEMFFNSFLAVSYVLLFATYLGFYDSTSEITLMNNYINVYVCLFLIWRFNPFRKLDAFTDLDRKIAFSAGVFIITTTALNRYVVLIQDTIQKLIASFEKKL